MKPKAVTHQFVERFPNNLEKETLYISIDFATAAHLCCCGCGQKVVTPFSPTDWRMTFDGEAISLEPSIGNWNFACRSHYFLRRNKVVWAGDMSSESIEVGRARDRMVKAKQYGDELIVTTKAAQQKLQEIPLQVDEQPTTSKPIWAKFMSWFS